MLLAAEVWGGDSFTGFPPFLRFDPNRHPALKKERDKVIDELRVNQKLWRQQSSYFYRFEFQVLCFCEAMTGADPIVVEIIGRKITGLSHLSSGAKTYKEKVPFVSSVDELFDHLIAAAQSNERVRVTFDPILHYPAAVSIGWPENDGGFSLTLQNLYFF
jgi:hypothetical protein